MSVCLGVALLLRAMIYREYTKTPGSERAGYLCFEEARKGNDQFFSGLFICASPPLLLFPSSVLYQECFLTLLLKEHDFPAFFSYTCYILVKSKRLEDLHGLWGKY